MGIQVPPPKVGTVAKAEMVAPVEPVVLEAVGPNPAREALAARVGRLALAVHLVPTVPRALMVHGFQAIRLIKNQAPNYSQ
ncbi:hypothetical protein VRB50_10540 [Pseudomonas poae]|uniref:Uncharacterized protein n=2 Tax=Pseudomonas poae TaxID=200451 RepID=A0AAP2S5V3_9PSED|nr:MULTISPECIES: hypothetical protein [Pseudomonas]AGE25580.1 hypothetical protein H045_07550 [Pseudomonas poae RE*1-1-14]KTC33798.1 hypothetical protein AO260_13720 [Pseudomonas sp. ABAC21]MCF5657281.1 hypothetical protein [Pseudomonas poae]MCF5779671.1 hypothetical protein [Pseudomonas poae]